MIKTKELEQNIANLVENFTPNNYKMRALGEMNRATTEENQLLACAKIVADYPDFDHVQLKITVPNRFVVKFCINPSELKDNPKMIKKFAKAFKGWLKYCNWGD